MTSGAGTYAAAAVAADYVEDLVLGTVREVHTAVAGRAFGVTNRATGGAVVVPQVHHDRITGGRLRRIQRRTESGDRITADGG